jgi:hypothetical protein
MSQTSSLDHFMLSPRATNGSVRSSFTTSKDLQSYFTTEYLYQTPIRREQLPVDFDELSKDSRFQDDISASTHGSESTAKQQGKKDQSKIPKRASSPNNTILSRAASTREVMQSQSRHPPSPFRETKLAKLLIAHGLTIDLNDGNESITRSVPPRTPNKKLSSPRRMPKIPKSPSQSKSGLAKSININTPHQNKAAFQTSEFQAKKGGSCPRRVQSERRKTSSCGSVLQRNSSYASPQISRKRSTKKPSKPMSEVIPGSSCLPSTPSSPDQVLEKKNILGQSRSMSVQSTRDQMSAFSEQSLLDTLPSFHDSLGECSVEALFKKSDPLLMASKEQPSRISHGSKKRPSICTESSEIQDFQSLKLDKPVEDSLPKFEKLWNEDDVPGKIEFEMMQVAAEDMKRDRNDRHVDESETDRTETETEFESLDGEESHYTSPVETKEQLKEADRWEVDKDCVQARRISKQQMKFRLQNIESRFTDVLGKLNTVADRLRKVNESFQDTLSTSTHSSDSSLTVCSAEVEHHSFGRNRPSNFFESKNA